MPSEIVASRTNRRQLPLMRQASRSCRVADGTMEEPFHLIADVGYGNLYPEVFGTRRGTQIANLTDNARGGYFERTPDEYPEGAWYTNPTKGCQYGCPVGKYFIGG